MILANLMFDDILIYIWMILDTHGYSCWVCGEAWAHCSSIHLWLLTLADYLVQTGWTPWILSPHTSPNQGNAHGNSIVFRRFLALGCPGHLQGLHLQQSNAETLGIHRVAIGYIPTSGDCIWLYPDKLLFEFPCLVFSERNGSLVENQQTPFATTFKKRFKLQSENPFAILG